MKYLLIKSLILTFGIFIFVACNQNVSETDGSETVTTPTGNGNTPEPEVDAGVENNIVRNVKASCFSYADKIEIQWDSVPEVTNYKILRYSSYSDNSPAEFFSTTPKFIDNQSSGALQVTPYFYKIEAVHNNITYSSEGYVLGIYDQYIDNYQNNNSESDVKDIDTSIGGYDACLYSIVADRDTSEIILDEDWYVYKPQVNSITPYDPSFNFKLTYTGSNIGNRLLISFGYYSEGTITWTLPQSVSFSGIEKSFTNSSDKNIDEGSQIYIKVYHNPDPLKLDFTDNFIFKYKFSII